MGKKSNLSRLMDYAGNHKYLTYASLVLSGISSLVALVPFWYIWKIIKEVLEVMPNFEDAKGLVHNGYMSLLFAIISILIYIVGLLCSHLSAFRVASNLRIDMVKHIAKLPLGFAESFGTGKLRKIINDSSSSTETYLAHMLPDMVGSIFTPIGLLVLLIFFDWHLGLLSLVPVVIAFIIMATQMTGKTLAKSMEEYQNSLEDMSNEAVEYVRGIPVVKTFGQTVFTFERFKKSIDSYSEWAINYTKNMRFPMMCYTTIINGIFAFLIGAGIYFTKDGISSEFLLNLIFYIIITPLITLVLNKVMFQSENNMVINDAMSRIDSILELNPLETSANPQTVKDNSIELRHVFHTYDNETYALDDVSLKIEPNKTVAFVGASGSGKTTIANIISRFFDVTDGEVLIGGVNVKDIPKDVLMENVSFVFQNSRLIKASILENVRMGRPNATKEEVLEVLKSAQCMDIIEKFPQGVDTVIGSKGVYLSGGEQQRVAIARTMLKDSPIIILDEATAFADADNEYKVQMAFDKLSKDKTVIMIAHRLSTISNVDEIFVLDKGRIVESGTSAELISKGGVFAKMWKEYQTSTQWKV